MPTQYLTLTASAALGGCLRTAVMYTYIYIYI